MVGQIGGFSILLKACTLLAALLFLLIPSPFMAHAIDLSMANQGPYVKETLILSNNTLVPGNVVPTKSGTPSASSISIDSSNGDVYATIPTSNSVVVINGARNLLIANVTVGYQPIGIAYDASNGYVYVANGLDRTVSVIDGSTNRMIANLTIGVNPISVAFDPRNGDVLVGQYVPFGQSRVIVVDIATNAVIANVTVGFAAFPMAMAFDSWNSDFYVSNSPSSTISIIGGTSYKIVGNVSGLDGPSGIAFDPSNGCIYVADASNSVSVINGTTNTVVATIGVGRGPSNVVYDSSRGYVYVTDSESNSVAVIDGGTSTLVGNVSVGRGPSGIAFDSANGYTYVANFPEVGGSATVSIIAWRSTPNTLTPYLVIGGIAASISLALAIVITFRKWIRNQSQKRIYSKNTCTPPVGTSPSTNPGTNLPSWRSPRGSA